LLAHSSDLLIIVVTTGSEVCLSVLLVSELLKMRRHVNILLGLVEGVDALFEESVLDTIILLLGVGNFLGGLVVAELASFG